MCFISTWAIVDVSATNREIEDGIIKLRDTQYLELEVIDSKSIA